MKRLLILLAISVVVLSGCSEDRPVGPADAGSPSDPMLATAGVTATLIAHSPNHGVPAGAHTYEIIIENLTPATGSGASQPFSPPVLATHRKDLSVFRLRHFASEELAYIAQDAINGPMIAWLTKSGKTFDIVEGDGVILPGGEARYEVLAGPGMRRLSAVFMLVNTNDGFSGLNAIRLPVRGESVHYLRAYDAGSEQNTELVTDIPGPCCGSPGVGPHTRERIRYHQGILGVGDLNAGVYGWTEPVAKLTVRRVTPAYEIQIDNLTPQTIAGGSQVFSPPILATHNPNVRMFRVGGFASEELSRIAEDGDTGPMVDRLKDSRKVTAVITGDGPILPGGSAMYEIQGEHGFSRLSIAFMLVNTNDGFSGVDRLQLPRGGRASYYLGSYDAGSEQNTELASDIPGPCCGNPGQGPDEYRHIRPHSGILGIGDLDVGDYGWTDPAAKLTITRIK